MTTTIQLTCAECLEPAEECDHCGKAFKVGTKIFCASNVDESADLYANHFCSLKCFQDEVLSNIGDPEKTKVVKVTEDD